MPLAAKPRPFRPDDPPDLQALPEADKTKENRGAVGIKQARGSVPESGGSLSTNEVSGTIGGDTPSPIFDRAALAAGQKGALATERVGERPSAGAPGGSGPTRTNQGGHLGTGTGANTPARGTPRPGAVAEASLRSSVPLSRAVSPSQVIVDDGLEDDDSLEDEGDDEVELPAFAPSAADPRFSVPVGEFEHGEMIAEQDKRRGAYAQATIKRDAASALAGVAGPAPAAVRLPSAELRLDETAVQLRGNALFNDASGSSTGRFERGDPTRSDPTIGDDRGDATALSISDGSHAAAGTLRNAAALPRKRGIAGDLRYVATVVFGVRDANRELAALQAKQATRQQSRRHHLVTLGRTAVTLPEWIVPDRGSGGPGGGARAEHPALGPAREQLSRVEEERAQHAGHVAAADAELTRVRRDREAKAKQYQADLAALDAELLAITRKLEPLDKEAAGLKKRAADLRDSLRRIDGKIASTEASLTSVKAGKLDLAAVQAELATLKADRKAIRRDEPVLAGQLDALSPRIAALEAARGEAERKREELAAAEQEDQRRVEELLTAIGAKRKVVDRATAEAEARRDKILFQLGERLYVDRPEHLTGQLAPIDEIDVEFGIADRRIMELREIVSSIDKRKVARGVALIVLILGAIGALIFLVISLRS
jgi:predicted  nucleic acid-binding Zn-ribbon protein